MPKLKSIKTLGFLARVYKTNTINQNQFEVKMKETFAYGRVSRETQNPDSQVDRFLLIGVKQENIYIDKDSGKKDDRKNLQELLSKLRAGDKVIFYDLTRLGRNPRYLITLVDHFYENKIDFQDLTNPFINTLSTATAEGEFVFGIFAFLGQFIRRTIVDKVNAGIASAKARGVTGGRPRGISNKLKEKAPKVAKLYTQTNMTNKEICDTYNIAPNSLYKCLKHEGINIKINTNRAAKNKVA